MGAGRGHMRAQGEELAADVQHPPEGLGRAGIHQHQSRARAGPKPRDQLHHGLGAKFIERIGHDDKIGLPGEPAGKIQRFIDAGRSQGAPQGGHAGIPLPQAEAVKRRPADGGSPGGRTGPGAGVDHRTHRDGGQAGQGEGYRLIGGGHPGGGVGQRPGAHQRRALPRGLAVSKRERPALLGQRAAIAGCKQGTQRMGERFR